METKPRCDVARLIFLGGSRSFLFAFPRLYYLMRKNMNPVFLEGNSQQSFAISSSAAQSAALHEGLYDVWSTIDCYIKVEETATDVTTSTGYILFAYNVVTLGIDESRKIGAITTSGTGTLQIHKVD